MGFRYFDEVTRLLQQVQETQSDIMEEVAGKLADVVAEDGIIHVFGTGHSHMLAEESFYRAGGLAPVNAVLDPGLMLHHGAVKSTRLERLPGYAQIVLDDCRAEAKDAIIVISNSGVNAVPVEMALAAREKGLLVIAITARQYAESVPVKHPSGKRLHEIADYVIDNCGQPGDAIVSFPGLQQKAGPSSTVIGAAILNSLYVRVIELLMEREITPPVYISANMPGAEENNAGLVCKYRNRIKLL